MRKIFLCQGFYGLGYNAPMVTNRPFWRTMKAFWFLQGARPFGGLLVAALLCLFFAVWRFRTGYAHPDVATPLTWMQAAWQVMGLMFFQAAYPMPANPTVGLLFFLIPLGHSYFVIRILLPLFRAIFNKETWNMALAKTYQNHVIVCGLGRVGFRTVQRLLEFKEEVVGIGSKDDERFIEDLKALNIPIIRADARRQETLLDAGLARAAAIVPCTNDDLANFDIALIAQKENPKIKIVMRMFDDNIAQTIRHNFGQHFSSFSTSEISGRVFAAAAATKAPIDFALELQSQNTGPKVFLTIGQFKVKNTSPPCGITVQAFEEKFQAAVLAIQRQGSVVISPKRQETLAADDMLVISAEIENLEKIHRA